MYFIWWRECRSSSFVQSILIYITFTMRSIVGMNNEVKLLWRIIERTIGNKEFKWFRAESFRPEKRNEESIKQNTIGRSSSGRVSINWNIWLLVCWTLCTITSAYYHLKSAISYYQGDIFKPCLDRSTLLYETFGWLNTFWGRSLWWWRERGSLMKMLYISKRFKA